MPQVIEASSAISRVEVYRNLALVTRQASLNLEGGAQVRLGRLPVLLEDDSVRAALSPEGGAQVVDLHVGWELSERGGPLDTRAEEQLRELASEMTGLQVERKREQDFVRFLESLTPEAYATVDLPEKLAFAERKQLPAWLKLEDYLEKELLERRSTIRELERKIEDLEDRIRDARDRLRRQSRAEAELLKSFRKAVRLTVEAERPTGNLTLELSYLVPFARWVPEYELRVDQAGQRAEMILKALVAQSTGEDWTGTALSFSTADLRRSAELPELESWRIGKAQPARPSGWRELPDTLEELFREYDRGTRAVPAPAIPARAALPSMPRLEGTSEVSEADTSRSTGRDLAKRLSERVVSGHKAQDKTLEPPADVARKDDLAEGVDDFRDNSWAASVPPPPPAPARPSPVPSGAVAGGAFEIECEPEEQQVLMEQAAAEPVSKAIRRSRKTGKKEVYRQEEFKKALPRGQAAPADYEEPVSVRIGASGRALTFGSLRMQGPDDPARGQLVAENPLQPVADLLEQSHPGAAGLVRERGDQLLGALYSEGDRLTCLALPEHAVAVEHSAGHFAVRYLKEGAGTVLSDGQLHGLTLLGCQGEVRRLFRCVPALDTQAYRIAEFKNPLGLPLLSGPVSVYRGGDFLVRSPLTTTPPGKEISVNLGVEPGIRVARNVHFNESTAGMFGGDTLIEHRVELEVRSGLDEPARVELFERVPVSHEQDVRVEVIKTEPAAEKYDQKERGAIVEGGLCFSLDLAPGEKKRCELRYRITIPSKQVLRGGNRRD